MTCDGAWEDHEVVYEMAEDRKMHGKPVGESYLPLSANKNIQQQVFNKEKYAMIKEKSLPPAKNEQIKK